MWFWFAILWVFLGYDAFCLYKDYTFIRVFDTVLNEVAENLFHACFIHVNLWEEPEVPLILQLHLDMQTFLHGLIPEQVFHVIQEIIQSKRGIIWFELIRVHARKIKDITDKEIK